MDGFPRKSCCTHERHSDAQILLAYVSGSDSFTKPQHIVFVFKQYKIKKLL